MRQLPSKSDVSVHLDSNAPPSPPTKPVRSFAAQEALSRIMSETTPPKRRPRKLRKHADNDEDKPQGVHHEEDEATDTFERSESELPPLPVDGDSFLDNDVSGASFEREGNSTVDEHEMRRQLLDVESSFLPEPVPAPHPLDHLKVGADDTYLSLGSPGRTPPPDKMFASLMGGVAIENQHRGRHLASEISESSPQSPPNRTPTAHQQSTSGAEERDENRERLEDSSAPSHADGSSSPAAAAAERTHTRNVSTASVLTPMRAKAVSIRSGPQSQSNTPLNSRPSTPSQQPSSEIASLLNLNGVHSLSPSRLAKRPSYLTQRHSSQRSSTSSATLASDLSGSDVTVNADYALQSGGAVPGQGSLSSRASMGLSRLPSLGSVASYISHDSDSTATPALNRGISGTSVLAGRLSGLDKLEEERGHSRSPPATPRPTTAQSNIPTDTVIAQHVQSIQVPETVAKEFRARHRSISPDKRPASSSQALSFSSRPRSNLTLKEQNSKIDKLTKENFDLKLKIHFLDQALQSRSDDGVKEMIDKNVQLQTDLANERKESQGLRRRVREMERKMKEQEEGLAEARRNSNESVEQPTEADPQLYAEMEEEIMFLREQVEHSESQNTRLMEENLAKEVEKRKMAEHVRAMNDRPGSEPDASMKETMEMWQDLLTAESGRREQAEEDVRKLRDEVLLLRSERSAVPTSAPSVKNFYNITKRNRFSYAQSNSGESEYTNGQNGTVSGSSATLVEQLKHENVELRRDLGAQTSMLTSRNRERERLQQEIEDLKLVQRKSDGARSLAGDSIFERSISRAHQRSTSRASEHTGAGQIADAEREDWEKKEGALRDQNAELRLKFQDLERTHATHQQYIAAVEADFLQLEQELEEKDQQLQEAVEDLQALQTERDDALQAFEEKELDCQKLEQDALVEIDKVDKNLQRVQTELQRTQKEYQKTYDKLQRKTEDSQALQQELRGVSQSFMGLEDTKRANMATIEQQAQQINEYEDELQSLDKKIKELEHNKKKLEITQESLHNEIAFLREEQEGDKIKIGELEDSLNAAQQMIQDEKEKLQEMEEAIEEERRQRDVLENQSKEEVQQVLDDLNADNSRTKDEVRRLRRSLSAKEVEATTFKTRLEELESGLRETLGDANGTRSSMLSEIERIQRDLETTANDLDRAKMDLADKDRLLHHRDGLLESTSLESRRLSDLLDKERNARKHELDQFERAQRGTTSHVRTIAQKDSRILELETAFSQDKRRMSSKEQEYRDQLLERNNLLLALWNRLSTLCGADWAQNHSLVNGEVPSADVIARSLPGFNKNVILAVKTIEGLIGSFKHRIRGIEKDLWRDFQTLEKTMDMRLRRMDLLERAVKDTQDRIEIDAQQRSEAEAQLRPQASRTVSSRSVNMKGTEEIGRLKSELKVLKAELKFHRQHPSAMAQQMLNQQQQMSPDQARRQSTNGSIKPPSPARQIMSSLLSRAHSTSVVEQLQDSARNAEGQPGPRQQPIVLSTPPIQASEQRWIHRLKELERRLKAEREARLLDRRGARQRLEEGRVENEELRQMLEREKVRRESLAGSFVGSERRGSELD